jgi:xanthine dehydrogenase YagS FAD-binding subunit
LPLVGFHRLPGDAPERDTVLEHGDLITHVELPPDPIARRSLYRKARERRSFSFALVSVAAALELDGDAVADARIALGGVAHAPWRAAGAEAALRGGPADRDSFTRAAALALEGAQPLRDNAYKLPMARNLIVLALEELAGWR